MARISMKNLRTTKARGLWQQTELPRGVVWHVREGKDTKCDADCKNEEMQQKRFVYGTI